MATEIKSIPTLRSDAAAAFTKNVKENSESKRRSVDFEAQARLAKLILEKANFS
jgi:hypothetical protein